MASFTMEYWQDDGWFVGRLREIPGCFSQAETVEELEHNLLEVYELLREDTDSPTPPHALTRTVQTAA
jgi:predicted RNase H-like HicB family nuclease